MIKPLALSLASIALVAGCDGKPLTFEHTPVQAKRFYADTFQDAPFDTGQVTVLSAEHGDLHTFTLRPCGDGLVCGTRQGTVAKAPDYYVVTGAYAGRIFYLSPGGDGWVKRDGQLIQIAWD